MFSKLLTKESVAGWGREERRVQWRVSCGAGLWKRLCCSWEVMKEEQNSWEKGNFPAESGKDGRPGFAFGPLPKLSWDRRRLLPRQSISGMSCSERSSQEGFLEVFWRIFPFPAAFQGHLFSLNGGHWTEGGFQSGFALAQCWDPKCFCNSENLGFGCQRWTEVIFHCSVTKVICRYYLVRDFCQVYCQAFTT